MSHFCLADYTRSFSHFYYIDPILTIQDVLPVTRTLTLIIPPKSLLTYSQDLWTLRWGGRGSWNGVPSLFPTQVNPSTVADSGTKVWVLESEQALHLAGVLGS